MIVEMRDGLLEHGYREDVDFFLGVRFTQGDINALDAAAHELVQYGVDLMFVDFDAAARAAQQATTEIPIVFGGVADPIGMGLVQSFARPGGNITGVTDMELHLGPKRLQMFKEMIPHLQRVWFPYDAADAYAVTMSKSTETRLGNWGLRWWRRRCGRKKRRRRSSLSSARARWMGSCRPFLCL